jgi:small subunit ribosomal protein S17
MTEKAKKVRERRGIVVRDRMEKTVVVEVTRKVRHPKYHKFITRRARYKAHDAENACKVGDQVILEETRPLSKTKRWRIKEIVEKATVV